jgi:hypothetical protein
MKENHENNTDNPPTALSRTLVFSSSVLVSDSPDRAARLPRGWDAV